MRKTVLIVDDDPVSLRMAKETMSTEQYKVVPALSVKQGIKIIRKMAIDLIVTDYMMPEQTGMDLLAYLDSEGYRIPVIMASSRLDNNVKAFAHLFGARHFLDKPYTADQLLQMAERALWGERADEE